METDLKLRALVDKFGTDLAGLIAKRDGAALVGQLTKMKAALAGKKGAKASPSAIKEPSAEESVDALVGPFRDALLELLGERDTEVVEGAFERLESQLLNPVAQPTFRPPKLQAPRKPGDPNAAPGTRAGVTPKPCPVPGCGIENVARRYSFLCDKHRSEENQAMYKAS